MRADIKPLRVLHLASFSGNIGDVANHAGARFMFGQCLDFPLVFTELEIREFYWKQRSFDDDFVAWANSFDLLLIGGGNYFELWVENSSTGTSIDLTPSRLAALSVPTLFYSLGVDTGQGYTQRSADRFGAFMRTVLTRESMFVCVRNDGSSRALHEVLASQEAECIPVMPDGGFFAARSLAVQPVKRKAYTRLGINIAGDMLERRFSADISSDGFLKGLAAFCAGLLDARDDLHIEFMPHIWRDAVLISELLPMIKDSYLRRRIAIAALDPTAAGLQQFLERYQTCDLVLGMRFHANVCPIGMGVPTRGLLNYPQVGLLYEELGFRDRLLDVRVVDFERELQSLTISDLEDDTLRARYRGQMLHVDEAARSVLKAVNTWLHARYVEVL